MTPVQELSLVGIGRSAGFALAASAVYHVGLLGFKRLVDDDDELPLATILLRALGRTDGARPEVRYATSVLATAAVFLAGALSWGALGGARSSGPIAAGLGGLLLGETLLRHSLADRDTAGRLATITHGVASVAGVATLVATVATVQNEAVAADQSAVANFLVSLRLESLFAAAVGAVVVRRFVGDLDGDSDRVWRQTVFVCLAAVPLGIGSSGFAVSESTAVAGAIYAGLWALLWLVMVACVNGYLSDDEGTPITSIPNPDGQTTRIE